jgi:hypothetical protein
MLITWSSFFQGELGAAAALAGLLFVSVSVNQVKILQLGRMADRGLEALGILFLIIVVTSLALVPEQPLRLLGAEILVVGTVALIATILLQRSYMRHIDAPHRRRPMRTVVINRVAVSVITLAGLTLLWRGDGVGLYLLPAGILLSLLAASAGAWVLLVEINR